MSDFNNMPELNIGLLVFSGLVTLFLLIGILSENRRSRPFMNSYILLLVTNVIMQLGEIGIWAVQLVEGNRSSLQICSFISFGGGCIITATYTYCLIGFVRERESVSYLPAHIISVICGIYFILIFISLFNGMIYSVDSQGKYVDGPLGFISWAIDPCILIADICLVIYYRKYMSRKEVLCMLSFSLLTLPTMLLQKIWYPVPEFLSTTLAMIWFFMLFHGELTRQLMEKEKQLVESRVAITISQIQPHFLYNTLSTIGELCRKDPAMAEEVSNRFAQYLRVNLEHMGDTVPVPFSKELQHVKTYLWIEKMRFREDINIVYDIQTEDFMIPSLAVQPLVENAVKHGMMESEDVCTITIRTRDREEYYEITIMDDGGGFDMEEKRKDDKSHIGIDNVIKRIELMVNGTVNIYSHKGEGTSVIIRIPKEMNKNMD